MTSYTGNNKKSFAGWDVLKNVLMLTACATVVYGCAGDPGRASVAQSCERASVDFSEPMPTAAPSSLPPSNIFDLKEEYPPNLLRDHLEGRALVRLTVGVTGQIEHVRFLRLDAPLPVKSAMCHWLQKIRYDLSKSGFETPESRTWVMGVRYILRGSHQVPAYPGFEKWEITIAASLL